MKKALLIANMGGFATFLISDIDILKKMGYEVTFLANTEALPWNDTKEKLLSRNVKIIHLSIDSKNPASVMNIYAYKKLKKILKEEEYELIHCHTPIAGLITRLAAKRYRKNGTKVIYTTHGFSFSKYSSKKDKILYYSLEKILSKYSDGIITINQEDYKNAKKMYCKNVFYINGVGVKINDFVNVHIDIKEYRKNLGIDYEKIMVLSIGEISKRKNHKIIIEAIGLLENKSDYVYAICGNGVDITLIEELKKCAEKNNVNLKLLGFRFDIPEIIKCSDFGAIPSIREGLGLAGIQSLAAGKPLIATDVQGIKDYVIDGKTGFMSSPYDAEKMATNIRKLSNKTTREKMKKNCEEEAKKFDFLISEKQREKIYQEILNKR